jgi:hypothetical protein
MQINRILIGWPSTFDRKAGHVPTSTLKKQDKLKFILFLSKILKNSRKN